MYLEFFSTEPWGTLIKIRSAFGAARAMFTAPTEIERGSAYRTGFQNELVIVDIIAELEAAGRQARPQPCVNSGITK